MRLGAVSALIDLRSVMSSLEAEAGGVVLVFQEVRRRNGQHVAGDPATDKWRIGARIVITSHSVLRAGDDQQVKVAVGTRGAMALLPKR